MKIEHHRLSGLVTCRRAWSCTCWLFILLFSILSANEIRANVSPYDPSETNCHNVFQGTGIAPEKILGVSREHPGLPARAMPFTPERHGDPWKDNCYYRENFRNFADRGHDSFIFYAPGNISGRPALPEPGYHYSQVIPYSSRSGDSWKIRPPPLK
jgi:hypothetical protein